MLLGLIQGNGTWWEILIGLLVSCTALLIVLPVHEWAHSYTAYKLGDTTQLAQGRLTLNPFHHLDPLGAICIILTGFGWAKPVYVNTSLFERGGRFANAYVSMAGPAANIIMGFIFGFLWQIINRYFPTEAGNIVVFFIYFFIESLVYFSFVLSIRLAVFNLIPVPPLDGYGILSAFLPRKARYVIYKNRRIFSIIFMVLLITGLLSTPITFVTDAICDGISALAEGVIG